MLETDEEIRARLRRNAILAFFGFVLLLFGSVGFITWESIKPLPQVEACKAQGYEGGIEGTTGVICYDDCEDNIIETCGTSRTLR